MTTDTANKRPLLRIPEVAQRLDISTAMAWRMAQRGELPLVRIGRSVRMREEDLDAWIEARTTR